MSDTKRVLVVDDDPDIRFLIAKVIEKHGAQTTLARNGKEAQQALQELEQFDLVFLDLLMPHVSGWSVLDSIKSSPTGERIPVVMVSGAPISDKEKEKLSQRVTAFVAKDTFKLAEFEELVERLLAGNR